MVGDAPSEPLVGDTLGHAELLERTARQARERGFNDLLIVDADFHHTEGRSWREILEYVENDVVQHFLRRGGNGEMWIPGSHDGGGIQEVAGRIQPFQSWVAGHPELSGSDRDVALAQEAMAAMGSNYVSFFPGWLLDLGTFPYDLETHLARAWARWAVDMVLPKEPGIITLLPLPLGDPEACLAMVEEFSDVPQVVGFMVTSLRYEPLYRKRYARLFRAIEERGLPLGFHSSFTTAEPAPHGFNRFLSVHSLGFPYYQMVQATNWIVNGMPERYPDLKLIFIEGGLAWVPFLMQRLDHEFLMRSSEAPLLERLPSEYMRDFYYTSQPMEAADPRGLEMTLQMIGADTQLMYASDWPHWDWDPPSKVWDLPFLDERAKRNILGENARRLYKLPPKQSALAEQPDAAEAVPAQTAVAGVRAGSAFDGEAR